MDNSPVSEQAKQKVKRSYLILSVVIGLMTAVMWAVVGSAIHFIEGAYWVGSIVCAGMLFLSLLCSIRVYRNVEHFTTETKSNIEGMIDILVMVCLLTSVSSGIGLVVGMVSLSDSYSANKGENDIIASGAMVAGNFISIFTISAIRIANTSSIELKLNLKTRIVK